MEAFQVQSSTQNHITIANTIEYDLFKHKTEPFSTAERRETRKAVKNKRLIDRRKKKKAHEDQSVKIFFLCEFSLSVTGC